MTGTPDSSEIPELRFDIVVLEVGFDARIDLVTHERAGDHARILLGGIATGATLHEPTGTQKWGEADSRKNPPRSVD